MSSGSHSFGNDSYNDRTNITTNTNSRSNMSVSSGDNSFGNNSRGNISGTFPRFEAQYDIRAN